jgi:hypothetical protein
MYRKLSDTNICPGATFGIDVGASILSTTGTKLRLLTGMVAVTDPCKEVLAAS